jgi:hypothetical protein
MGRPIGPAACTTAPPAGLLPQQARWATSGLLPLGPACLGRVSPGPRWIDGIQDPDRSID